MQRSQILGTLLVGGVLPIVAFAVVENYYGTVGGLIAGIFFGLAELIYEKLRFGKLQGITIAANLMVIVLGGLSLIENDPVFFKLQPAFMIFAFSGLLIGSSALKKPFLLALARKQNPTLPESAHRALSGLNLRLGLFMILIGALSVYAAYRWSTAHWAILKGVGVPLLIGVYMLAEVLWIRFSRRQG